MRVNFNEDEMIVMLDEGIQLCIQKEEAISLAKQIKQYYDEEIEDDYDYEENEFEDDRDSLEDSYDYDFDENDGYDE